MPYIALVLDDSSTQPIAAAAERLQAGSAFLSQLDERAGLGCHPFHVTLIGGLHVYADAELVAALDAGRATLPIRGRYVRWRLSGSSSVKLQVEVTLEETSGLERGLQGLLPRGKPWQPPHHITVGSMVGIQKKRHAEFLAAVEAAFPIDPTSGCVFTCAALDYDCKPAQAGARSEPVPAPAAAPTAAGTPVPKKKWVMKTAPKNALPPLPLRRSTARRPAATAKAAAAAVSKPSPHRSWQRPSTSSSAGSASTSASTCRRDGGAAGGAAPMDTARAVGGIRKARAHRI